MLQHEAGNPLGGAVELTHGIAKAGVFVTDFDGAVEKVRARGVAFLYGPYSPHNGQRANVSFKDHAGNIVEVLGPAAGRNAVTARMAYCCKFYSPLGRDARGTQGYRRDA